MVPVDGTNEVKFKVSSGTVQLRPLLGAVAIAQPSPSTIASSDGQIAITFSGLQSGREWFSVVDANTGAVLKKKMIEVDVKNPITGWQVAMFAINDPSRGFHPAVTPTDTEVSNELARSFLRQANVYVSTSPIQPFNFTYADPNGAFILDPQRHTAFNDYPEWSDLRTALRTQFAGFASNPKSIFATYYQSIQDPDTWGVSIGENPTVPIVVRGDLAGKTGATPADLFSANTTAHEIGHVLGLPDLYERGKKVDFLMYWSNDGKQLRCRIGRSEWNKINP
jgi:hypothetical protein